jgi:ornithine decarboxylase
MEARFVLSRGRLVSQFKLLEDLGLKVSYSYKTNRDVGRVLQEISDCDFSIHAREEIEDIENVSRVWFFTQAENEKELIGLLEKGVKNFVVDNEVDLRRLLGVVCDLEIEINLSLRMKFKEHRIGSGKYFVYGMSSEKVCGLISKIRNFDFVGRLGIHIHRKSQNTSEWRIKEEIEDSLKSVLDKIDFVNFGGGLPIEYRSSRDVFGYVSGKIKEAVDFLDGLGIESYIEPGRFLAGPCVKLECEIIQIYDGNIVVNTTIYNCALDNVLTNTKMLVEGEGVEGEEGVVAWGDFLIKGNSPTRDDIFRYNVKLKNPCVGDKIVFLNAGAYNYTTDFFGYKKLEMVDEDEITPRVITQLLTLPPSLNKGDNSTNPSEKKIVSVPMSLGCLGKNVGCEKAPEEILDGKDYFKVDVDENDFVESMRALEKVEGDVFVGGDHSMTYGLVKGFVSKCKNVGLIVFDAHPDCVNNFSPPTHEDYLRVLIEEGVVDCSRVLLVGLRKIDDVERKFLDSKGIEYICFGGVDFGEKIEGFLSKVENVYLSVDIDVLNFEFAPGTGYIEEGGFNLKELLELLKIVDDSNKVGRMDLVEVNPDKDVEGKTVESARRILEVFV